jgi:hypothetical protein
MRQPLSLQGTRSPRGPGSRSWASRRPVRVRATDAYRLKKYPELRPLLLGERRRFGDRSFDSGVDPLLLLAFAFLLPLLVAHAFF